MSYINAVVASGKTGDIKAETLIAGSDCSLVSSKIKFPLDTNGKKALAAIYYKLSSGYGSVTAGTIVGAGSAITIATGEISVSGTPTSALGVITDGVQGGSNHILAIGTDKKLKICDNSGTVLISASTAVPITGVGTQRFCAIWDLLTLGTGYWVSLVIDGTEEASGYVASPLVRINTAYWGDYTPAGSNYGAYWQGADLVVRYTATASDAPHLTQYPKDITAGDGSIMTADGDTHNWPNGTDTGGDGVTVNQYKEIDDVPNDGDTTRIADIQTSDPKTQHTSIFKHSTANPMGVGDTLLYAQTKIVGRDNGSGKNFCGPSIKYSGSSAADDNWLNTGLLGTTYIGLVGVHETAPSGSAWAKSDFDLSGGVSQIQNGCRSNVDAGLDTGADVTTVFGLAPVYYSNLLSLTTVPSANSDARPRRPVNTLLAQGR